MGQQQSKARKGGIYKQQPPYMMEPAYAYQPSTTGTYGSPYATQPLYQPTSFGQYGQQYGQYGSTPGGPLYQSAALGGATPYLPQQQQQQQPFAQPQYGYQQQQQQPLSAGGSSQQYIPTSYPQPQSSTYQSAKKPSKLHGGYQMMAGAVQGGMGKMFKKPSMATTGQAKEGYGVSEYAATTQPLYTIPQQQLASPVGAGFGGVGVAGGSPQLPQQYQPWQTPAFTPQQVPTSATWSRPQYQSPYYSQQQQQYQPASFAASSAVKQEELQPQSYQRYEKTSEELGGGEPVQYSRTGWEPQKQQQGGSSAAVGEMQQSTSTQLQQPQPQRYELVSQSVGGGGGFQPLKQTQQQQESLGGGQFEQQAQEEEVIMEKITVHSIL
ncbi:hypothetical protein MP228_011773 [Amoeboaphelidium protococcarum]|nr:hypothetical protein MP228_011773 [Amoeboaphelidium protococcarum]